jgi:hypothetical protein
MAFQQGFGYHAPDASFGLLRVVFTFSDPLGVFVGVFSGNV